MGQHYSLSGSDPRYTTQLVASHRPGQVEDCSKNGYAGTLLYRKSDLSVRNGVLLYKQVIRPLMDYACPAWRSAARSHVRRLQVLQSKYLRLATGAPWYVSNRQIHEDLGVPLFADHIRTLTESFDSKLTDVGNPLVQAGVQHAHYLRPAQRFIFDRWEGGKSGAWHFHTGQRSPGGGK